MEKRTAKINFSAAGGTASKGSKTCKITLPTSWLGVIGVDETNRMVDLFITGDEIIIKRKVCNVEYVKHKIKQNHNLKEYSFYDENMLCTTIYADFTDETLLVENHTDDPVKTAFGKNQNPTWQDFLAFLEVRVIPRGRDGLREYLEALGLTEYSPLEIIKKTYGRVAEDNQWLEEKAVSCQ